MWFDLDLQINLLAEQKTAKLIALVEELRRDLPNVKDRHDPQAAVMEQTTDPHVILGALEETLQESGQEGAGRENPETPEPAGPTKSL
jgi:uncharacterized membrane protein